MCTDEFLPVCIPPVFITVLCSGGGDPCFQFACNRSVDFRLGESKSGNCTCFLEPLREPEDVPPPTTTDTEPVVAVTVVFVGLCVGDAGRVAGRLELKQLVPVCWHVYLTGDIYTHVHIYYCQLLNTITYNR